MSIEASAFYDRAMENLRNLTDTHFHSIAMRERGIDVKQILAELSSAGAGPMVDVAIDPEGLDERRKLTGEYPEIVYSSGIHPSRSDRNDWEKALELVKQEAANAQVAAIGECGLDWYRLYAPRERQCTVMEAQLDIARGAALPVIVHNREADADVERILRSAKLVAGGVMHCFSSTVDWLNPFLDLGMYISFAGNVTFRSATELRLAAARVPDDRILIETDAPFLAPHPFRGKPNHPGLVVHTAKVVAAARHTTPEALLELVAQNARRLFFGRDSDLTRS